MSEDIYNATSLPESVAGPLPCNLPVGVQTDLFGQEVVPVSPLVSQVKGKGSKTPAICGQNTADLSQSVNLQLSLENRLRQRMAGYGSMEYELTWKHWDMKSGPPICALRASQHRISGKDYTGWPTPNTMDSIDRKGLRPSRIATGRTGGYIAEVLAGWVTPSSRDWKDTPGMSMTGTNPDGSQRVRLDQLPRQAAIAGQTSLSSPAVTGKRGVLNPELCRWLMGYPEEWGRYAVMVTP